MAGDAVAEVDAPGQAVGDAEVSSGRPANRQPQRPTAMPSASGPTQIAPVEPVMPRAPFVELDRDDRPGERAGDAVRGMRHRLIAVFNEPNAQAPTIAPTASATN